MNTTQVLQWLARQPFARRAHIAALGGLQNPDLLPVIHAAVTRDLAKHTARDVTAHHRRQRNEALRQAEQHGDRLADRDWEKWKAEG